MSETYSGKRYSNFVIALLLLFKRVWKKMDKIN
jgi:hypothetical protein